MTDDDHEPTDPRWRLSPTRIVVGIILLVAIVVPLLVGSYARVEPRLFGFPFFFWYQLAWVFLAAACCAISYLLLRGERRRFEAARGVVRDGGGDGGGGAGRAAGKGAGRSTGGTR